jgi:hypothetical protein
MSSSATTMGPSPIVPPLVVAALAADVPSCSQIHVAGSTVLGTTATQASWLPVLQLWEDRPLCQGLPDGQAGQFTMSSGTNSEPTTGPAEGSSTADWLH